MVSQFKFHVFPTSEYSPRLSFKTRDYKHPFNLFQMAITGHRNALGDITKQQNIPQKVALVDARVTTRQAAAKKLTPEVMVCDGHEDQVLERFIRCKSFLFCTLEQESACWSDGHRQEGLGEPASVRRVHPGHVSLPQVGFQCVFLR